MASPLFPKAQRPWVQTETGGCGVPRWLIPDGLKCVSGTLSVHTCAGLCARVYFQRGTSRGSCPQTPFCLEVALNGGSPHSLGYPSSASWSSSRPAPTFGGLRGPAGLACPGLSVQPCLELCSLLVLPKELEHMQCSSHVPTLPTTPLWDSTHDSCIPLGTCRKPTGD